MRNLKNRKISIKLGFSICLVFALLSIFLLNKNMLAQTPGSTNIYLYFLDISSDRLKSEMRSINQAMSTVDQAKLTLTELVKGSTTGLKSTIPEGTVLLELFIDEKGCAYASFSYPLSQNHPGGITAELITIGSIVQTLASNFPEEIQKVQILIGNKEAKTLAGHIDISKPIPPFEIK